MLWLFRMGLGLTVLVVGAVFVGVWGAWRLATLFPSNRSRMAVLVVYAAMPLVPGVISTGGSRRSSGTPRSRGSSTCCGSAVGIGTADPQASDDLVDGIIGLGRRERLRRTALVAVVAAVAAALAPAVLAVAVVVTLVLALAGLAAGSGLRTAGWTAGLGLVACADGVAAQPAVVADVVVGRPGRHPCSPGPLGRGVVDVASMAIGQARFEVAALALYVPVLVALAVARSWRLTWAARAAGLVIVFLALAVLQDRDALPVPACPTSASCSCPSRLGLALSAGAVGGGVRPGRRRPPVRLAPAAGRAGGSRSRAVRRAPGGADDRRRRVVHPAHRPRRAGRGAAPSRRPRSATTACSTSATRG